ncbi:MAG: hypothetical protein QGH39_02055, partial [Candidatus Thermoplasmatota archaeon]|nr:hypothetical protein [Candidatus Thermoplasmatota archaeon]
MCFYILELCSSKGAFEAVPNTKMKLELSGLEGKFREIETKIICNARVLLIIEQFCEVTIYPDGKLLLKTESEKEAR